MPGMKASGITLSLTKIVVPALRPEILSRGRLLARLDELLDYKLILITAPAGYGKTSLLIDLAHHTEMPLCWFSLDTLDRDPQRFIAYFIAAIARRFPHFGNQSTSALRSLTSLDQGLENLIITLANEIYEQVGEHFALVLDDYQFVDSVPEIRDFVSRFIQLASENCHLILSSRRLPALPDMAALVARQQVGGFDFQELAFNPDEIHSLFKRNYGIHLSTNVVENLFAHTEGWVTGLNLSGPEKNQGLPDRMQPARATDVSLSSYLDQQILDKQSKELRDFLLHTSLFDEFDAELCAAVLGALSPGTPRKWNKLIETVKQNNLFVLPVGPNGKWLRYHHLVQDFLQSRLREENPEIIETILIYLVQYYEQCGEWEKAHHVYQQLGDIAALADLAERAGSSLIQNDRIITLGRWLDELPEIIAQEHPGLLSLKGTVELLRGKIRYGLSLLDQALEIFRGSGDSKNLALTLVRRALALRLVGDYIGSLEDADQALKITNRRVEQEHQEIRVEALRLKGLAFYRLGKVEQSVEMLESSLFLSNKLDLIQTIPVLETELGMVHRALGDYRAAKDMYERALAIWKKKGNLTFQANLLNSLGVLHHTQGDYETAAITFEEGLDCARRSGYQHVEALLLTSLGDLYVEMGELEIARHTYEKAEDIARQTSDQFLLTYSLLSQAGIARASGSFDRARLLLNEVYIQVRDNKSNYEEGLYELEYGRLELVLNNSTSARQHLQTAVKSFQRGSQVLEEGWCHLWLAAADNQLGDRQSAIAHIKEISRHDENMFHSLSMAAYQVREWLDGGLENDPEAGPTLARMLNRAVKTQSKLITLRKRLRRLTSTVPMPPPHLDIKAFDKAQVRVNGELVTNAQWQTKSVRELFFYFLHSTNPVTKEQVGADFWPEVTPVQLKLRFKNDLYRLRRALGPEAILWEGDLYHFNHDLDYEYDVESFKTCLDKARAAKGIEERIQHYIEAVNLVHGRYLPDLGSTWVVAEQEHLEREFLTALLSLAKLLLQTGRYEEAQQISRRALANDACLEEAHRFLMRIYDLLGDHAAVTRQYQICRETLDAELGIKPSHETEELYRQLAL